MLQASRNIVRLSDQQEVDVTQVRIVELFSSAQDLLVTYQSGKQIKVHGSGVGKDADLLDEVRDRGRLPYLVFRKPMASV